MTQTQAQCVYCSKPVDLSRGQGDHVIPAALGRFAGEFIFRRICRDCNGLIGKCEEQLLRCAPEAFFRRLVQPTVKRTSRGTSWVGANGVPPPKFTVDHGTHHEIVEGSTEDPNNVSSIDQLVIVDKEKGERHVRLFLEMTVTQLNARIVALGVAPTDGGCFLHADEETYPKYVELLKELFPNSPLVEAEGRDSGVHRVEGCIKGIVHADYWRAIAKIGFHYYLLNTSRVHGDEAQFADIRRFIIVGGDHDPFFSKPAAQVDMLYHELPDGSAIVPHAWAHLLAAVETSDSAVAMVSLFMGPERLAPTYHINLGCFPSPQIVTGACCSHTYIYDAEPTQGTYAGGVVAETLTQLR